MKSALFIALLVLSTSVWAQQVDKYWSLEFDSANDLDSFHQETGAHGWGNNESQDYTTNNAIIKDGFLTIETRRPRPGYFTSSRLLSKTSFRYGKFEMRAKLPGGRGIWPAFWLLAANRPLNWPNDGEIDIMEFVGFQNDVIHATIHTQKYNHGIGTQLGQAMDVKGVTSTFHLYQLVWTPTSIEAFVDDKRVFEYKRENNACYDSWPFDNYFNIIINTAVGGWWGGAQGIDESIFPQSYVIDYVRYWPNENNTPLPLCNGGNNNQGVSHWNFDNGSNLSWAMSCDFKGNDLSNVQIRGEQCGSRCRQTLGCTHFSWNNYQGGTCWLKSGQVKKENAFKTNDPTQVCGLL